MLKKYILFTAFLLIYDVVFSQLIPSEENNIPSLVTFGKEGETSWGDDDFVQTWFFVSPKKEVKPVYIRIYDPETSGDDDEKKGEYNTSTKFSVYGGKACFTNKASQNQNPVGNYKTGNMLASKTFGNTDKYQGNWYTFGPFNPTEGEYVASLGGYVFKIIAEGISGDDGNLYKYFFSSEAKNNKAIEGGNAFTYEYTFRLSDNQSDVSHLYPFLDADVISINVYNFDFDNDGHINIVSVAKKGEVSKVSGENEWATDKHLVVEKEKKTSLDVQFVKNKTQLIKNNNVTLYFTNQYGHLIPSYAVPIGGIPKSINVLNLNGKNKTESQSINK